MLGLGGPLSAKSRNRLQGLDHLWILGADLRRPPQLGFGLAQISRARVNQAEILVKQELGAAAPADFDSFLELLDRFRHVTSLESRQGEVAQRVRPVAGLLLRPRSFKALLIASRFCGTLLPQFAEQAVQGLPVVGVEFRRLLPVADRHGAIAQREFRLP